MLMATSGEPGNDEDSSAGEGISLVLGSFVYGLNLQKLWLERMMPVTSSGKCCSSSDSTASEAESPAAIDRRFAMQAGHKHIDDAIKRHASCFVVASQRLDSIIARMSAQAVGVETSGARSGNGKKTKACYSCLYRQARVAAEPIFPIVAECCQELARPTNITQRQFIEYFATLLICVHRLPEEDGLEYIALCTAEWTSEGKDTSAQNFFGHCVSIGINDRWQLIETPDRWYVQDDA